ncbi:MAG: methionyl-tRNA formyltransferase [Myxococcales bacterium]|nr:methionyl-tRNA formyltransferase [Myxococcales bacterium]
MRVLFFGTPEFAVPSLEAILGSRHEICGVVSQPDRRRGRGRKTSPAPVAETALAAGVPLFRPEKVGAAACIEELRLTRADIGVVVAFGQFLTKRVRELPRCGYLINAHASLLPKFRGAAPIAHAILEGERETGISIMRVEREMDAGPVLRSAATPIAEDDTTGTLGRRLAQIAGRALLDALDEIEAGTPRFVEQLHGEATDAPKISRQDAELDFSESAEALARRVRAMSPDPGAYCEGPDGVLRILAALALPGAVTHAPGYVRRGDDPAAPLAIATSAGWLAPQQLQRPGGKPLPVAAFLRGHDISEGVRLKPVGSAARLLSRVEESDGAPGGS